MNQQPSSSTRRRDTRAGISDTTADRAMTDASANPTAPPQHPRVLPAPPSGSVTDLLLLFAAAAGMCWWTYAKWCDPIVDWGSQLYFAWQVSAGKVLYRDIAYFNGPFSIYFNALMFRVFGVSQRVLWNVNLVILGAIVVMLYTILRTLGGRLAAVVGGVVFVTVFAFSQYVAIGNYNYITPYTQEITHGLALDLLAICLLIRYQRNNSKATMALIGLAIGFCFLTKAEVFIAGLVGISIGIGLTLWTQHVRGAHTMGAVVSFIVAAIVPSLLALFLLQLWMPFEMALRGVAGTWPWVFDTRLSQMSFYRISVGTNDVSGNVATMLLWFGGVIVVAGALVWLSFGLQRFRIIAGIAVAMVVAIAFAWLPLKWDDALSFLPLAMLALLVGGIVQLRSFRHEPQSLRTFRRIDRTTLRIAMVVFAGAMLLKIALKSRAYHYGFVLAMPATMLLVEALVAWLPQHITRRNGNGLIFTAAACGMFLAMAGAHLSWTKRLYADKTLAIGAGDDAFLTTPARGAEVVQAMQQLQHMLAPADTLAAVPQGLMVNYLLRRETPVRFENLMQPEVVTPGADVVLEDWKQHPPDYLLVTRADIGEAAFVLENDHYGQELVAWFRTQYTQVWADNAGSMKLMIVKRKPTPAATDRR